MHSTNIGTLSVHLLCSGIVSKRLHMLYFLQHLCEIPRGSPTYKGIEYRQVGYIDFAIFNQYVYVIQDTSPQRRTRRPGLLSRSPSSVVRLE